MKNEFLSHMSRELRTPLNAVLGFSHLQMADTASPLPATQRQRAEHVQRAGQHLLSLIEEALDVASIESGHFAVSLELVDVPVAVAECLSTIEPQAQAQGVLVRGPAASPAPWRVIADSRRFRQVLLDLLKNVLKCSRPGGALRVSYHTDTSQDRVSIVVADTGLGAAGPDQERVVRLLAGVMGERRAADDLGRGLSVARLLVQSMAGTLQVESEAGRGPVITLSLPAAPPALTRAPSR